MRERWGDKETVSVDEACLQLEFSYRIIKEARGGGGGVRVNGYIHFWLINSFEIIDKAYIDSDRSGKRPSRAENKFHCHKKECI